MGTRIRIHALIAAVCLGLGFHGFTQGLMYIASGGGHKILGIPSVGDNNSFAVAILMVIPLMLYLAMYSADHIIKFSWFAGLTVSVISVVATFSRGGFIGMAMLGFGLVATSKRKAASLLMLAVAAVAIYAFAPAAWFARVDTIDSATSDDSFMGRVIAWKISTLVALARPFFGGGFHAIQSLPVWQAYQANFASLDFIPTSLPDVSPHAAHSIYFEVLGDLGFVGLFLFLSLLLLSFRNVQVIRKLSKGKPELAWAYDLANALRLSMIVYCVSAAALSMAYLELLYILLAATSRLRSMVEVELGLRDEKGRKLSGLALPIRPIEYGRPGSAALGHARLPRHPI
jgi:putative inorganic carbon (HCO3(-)) transporter